MDKKITELKEIDDLNGSEYLVVASEKDNENYKVAISAFIEDSVTVDNQLSETSKNPVQNKVITSHINDLEDRLEEVADTAGRLLNLHVAQVETVTLDSNEEANVEIIDLGTDAGDTKSLAFKFSIPRGATGATGEQGITGVGGRTVFVFKHSETKPDRPHGGSWDSISNQITYPEGWSPTDDLKEPIWMSNATFNEFRLVTDWSEPIRITGTDGAAGADGVKLEFIYKRFADEQIFDESNHPHSDPDVTDYVPEGWQDHPEGVTSTMTCEYVSTRSKDEVTGKWGAFTTPGLWAKYGANGKDGDGVEYIYQRTLKEVSPAKPGKTPATTSPTLNYQDREFIPASAAGEYAWTDNPTGTTSTFICEWVSTRKFKWDTELWGDWSTPALWAKYGKNGADGANGATSLTSIVFCRTNIKPAAPANHDGSYSNPIPSEQVKDTNGNSLGIYWSDGIPQGEETLYATQRMFSYDGNWPQEDEWSEPSQMTDTATYDVEFSASIDKPAIPSEDKTTRPNLGWYDPTLYPDFDFSTAIWRAERWKKNGVWTDWVIYMIKGEKGDAGTSISILGTYDSETALNNAYDNKTLPKWPVEIGDSYIVLGDLYVWDGDSFVNCGRIKGDTGESTYVHIKYSDDGGKTFTYDSNVGDYTGEIPGKYIGILVDNEEDDNENPDYYTWSKFKGEDGFGYEYIFKLTEEFLAPDVPDENTDTDVAPNGWTIDPSGVTANSRYEWACYRKSDSEGKWGPWRGKSGTSGKAWLFAMYAESVQGATGQQGPIIYPAGTWESVTYERKEYIEDGQTIVENTPYVWYDGSYWLLNTTSSSSAPGTNDDWLKMETFDAIYANIGAFNNALVGSAVFNGDYMFSQQGAGSGTYADFNHADPYADSNTFKPAWCVDLVTGKCWMATGDICFQAYGSLGDGYDGYGKIGDLIIDNNGIIFDTESFRNGGNYTRIGKDGTIMCQNDDLDQTHYILNPDGSGSLADNNIVWSSTGDLTIQTLSWDDSKRLIIKNSDSSEIIITDGKIEMYSYNSSGESHKGITIDRGDSATGGNITVNAYGSETVITPFIIGCRENGEFYAMIEQPLAGNYGAVSVKNLSTNESLTITPSNIHRYDSSGTMYTVNWTAA